MASNLEPMEVMSFGDSAIRQWVRIFWELAPYSRSRCFIPDGRVVERIALLMLDMVYKVHARCALGHREAARAVPR